MNFFNRFISGATSNNNTSSSNENNNKIDTQTVNINRDGVVRLNLSNQKAQKRFVAQVEKLKDLDLKK